MSVRRDPGAATDLRPLCHGQSGAQHADARLGGHVASQATSEHRSAWAIRHRHRQVVAALANSNISPRPTLLVGPGTPRTWWASASSWRATLELSQRDADPDGRRRHAHPLKARVAGISRERRCRRKCTSGSARDRHRPGPDRRFAIDSQPRMKRASVGMARSNWQRQADRPSLTAVGPQGVDRRSVRCLGIRVPQPGVAWRLEVDWTPDMEAS